MRKIFLFISILLASALCFSQEISKVSEQVNLDGIPNEKFWKEAYIFSDFTQNFPTDSIKALVNTEVKLAFDETHLYVFAICYHPIGQKPFVQTLKRDFNRIAGIDYNIASKDNKWRGKIFHHHAFQPNNPHRSFANASWLAYDNRNWFVMWNHEYVAKNYLADVGFVRRNRMFNPVTNEFMKLTYFRLEPMVRYNFFPKKGIINRHGPEFYMDYYTDVNQNPTDNLVRLSYQATFNNTSTISVRYGEVFTKLFFPTDASFTNKQKLLAGNYRYNTYGINYKTDFRKDLQAFISLFSGNYYTGNRYSINSSLTYRLKPYAIFSLNYERNQINLPEFNEPATLNLVGLQADVSFSTSVFFNTFLQYNSQINNVNINTRLQ